MKRLIPAVFLLAATIPASAAEPAPKGCNLNDQTSVCEIRLSVSELVLLSQVFENTEIPHAKWGPVAQDIMRQASPPAAPATPEKH